MATNHLEQLTDEAAQELMVKKLETLIEACKAGKIHQLVLLSDERENGHRMGTYLCDSDAHAAAFIDRCIKGLNEKLEKDFDSLVNQGVH